MPEFQSVNSQRNNIAIAHPRLKTTGFNKNSLISSVNPARHLRNSSPDAICRLQVD